MEEAGFLRRCKCWEFRLAVNVEKLFQGEGWSDSIYKLLIQYWGNIGRTTAVGMGAMRRDGVLGMREGLGEER